MSTDSEKQASPEESKSDKPSSRHRTKLIVAAVVVVVGILSLLTANIAFKDSREGVAADGVGNQSYRDLLEREGAQMTQIVMAVRDIAEGAQIRPEDLEEKQIPQSKRPEAAINQASMAGGRYAAVNIAQGTVLLNGHLTSQAPSKKQPN